uniref:Type II toxin-antitoxin system RelB/DinJ family antitoxin n=1 Tax=candidate division CPR3 bacterium TaxID=2268181 RepID=A0A7C4R530_UNCC3
MCCIFCYNNLNTNYFKMSTTKTSNIHIRINPNLKNKASKVLDDIGISFTQFIEINLNQIVKDKEAKMELKLMKDDKEDLYTEIKILNSLKK